MNGEDRRLACQETRPATSGLREDSTAATGLATYRHHKTYQSTGYVTLQADSLRILKLYDD